MLGGYRVEKLRWSEGSYQGIMVVNEVVRVVNEGQTLIGKLGIDFL